MLTSLYNAWCKFVEHLTATVPINRSIDEDTGEIHGYTGPRTFIKSSLITTSNYDLAPKNQLPDNLQPAALTSTNDTNSDPDTISSSKDQCRTARSPECTSPANDVTDKST